MKKEMSEASLLLFPVDTVSFSEGFSLSILQSHAAGLVPAISSADCIGSIYKDSGCIMVDAPIKNNLKEYTQKIIKALKDQTYANEITTKCKSFANKYLWTDIAKQMQEIIKNKGKINISDIASSTIIPVAASITPTIVIEDPVITSTKKVKLNIGCGPNLFVDEGWLNYDREPIPDHFPQYFRQMPWYNFLPHQQRVAKFYQEGGMLYFMTCDMVKGLPQHTDNSVDFIYKGQIIEHYNPIYQLPFVLQECYRVLKPGGIIRMTTPDLDLLINAYKNNEMSKFNNDQPDFYKTAPPSLQLALLMYGASGPDCRFDHYEGHYCLYNQESMTKILTDAGFKDIVYYYETGIGKDMETVKEVWDHGMSHSFIVEATK
jgi:SAM-dependent methyltransferase